MASSNIFTRYSVTGPEAKDGTWERARIGEMAQLLLNNLNWSTISDVVNGANRTIILKYKNCNHYINFSTSAQYHELYIQIMNKTNTGALSYSNLTTITDGQHIDFLIGDNTVIVNNALNGFIAFGEAHPNTYMCISTNNAWVHDDDTLITNYTTSQPGNVTDEAGNYINIPFLINKSGNISYPALDFVIPPSGKYTSGKYYYNESLSRYYFYYYNTLFGG